MPLAVVPLIGFVDRLELFLEGVTSLLELLGVHLVLPGLSLEHDELSLEGPDLVERQTHLGGQPGALLVVGGLLDALFARRDLVLELGDLALDPADLSSCRLACS